MSLKRGMLRVWALWLFVAAAGFAQSGQQSPAHQSVRVTLPPAASVQGRLLVFASKPGTGLPAVLSVNPFFPDATFVSGKELPPTAGGKVVDVDADELSYPRAFSTLPAGTYVLQALLDPDDSYSYGGMDAADWISEQIRVELPFTHAPTLVLSSHPPASPMLAKAQQALKPGSVEDLSVVSPRLTAFYGRETRITGAIALPPGYATSSSRYPTVYLTHGFGGNHTSDLLSAAAAATAMVKGDYPPMIYVFLDENLPTGTHEFADSVNNGPWGTALTRECIPDLETRYRMDAKRSGRFLTGHSSGGWATLQLQINYPEIFGGTWSTSPDSSDFHDFTGPDLYAANANVFRNADGTPRPLVRDKGKVIATIEQFSRLEEVLGSQGGQLASFDWVFSPRGSDGRPVPMYDRATGTVDPAVVRYWHDHYDLSVRLEEQWKTHAEELRGNIHVIVGTADTFYLDGAAHLFDRTMERLNTGTRVEFVPGRTHMDLYERNGDRRGLSKIIYAEMYASARPGSKP